MNLTLESEVARLLAHIDRNAARRFLADPEPPTGWADFQPSMTVKLGYAHPHDDSVIEWRPVQMTRKQLADALRDARYFRGERRTDTSIGLSVDGYSIFDWRR